MVLQSVAALLTTEQRDLFPSCGGCLHHTKYGFSSETKGAEIVVFDVFLPCKICRVHAVVKHVDSCDLTQDEIAEGHDEAVPARRGHKVKGLWK